MQPLVQRVRRTIRRHDLVPRGARVVAAVSGGSDSVALLHLLVDLQRDGDLVVAGIAHLNHRLRGSASDDDEAFCRAVAASLPVPIMVESVDVATAARQHRTSIEEAGRRSRYEFFGRAAASMRSDRVAVGHTLDDQAETLLLRLLRGAGPRGLAGIHPRAGMVIRPLLDISRDELREYLAEGGIGFREDASNLDVSIPRNRVRHELLPLMRRFSPAIAETLSREAEIAREDADYLDEAASAREPAVVVRTPENVIINLPALRDCRPALARRIVRRAMEAAAPDRFVGFDAVEAVLDLTDKIWGTGREVDVPGQRAERHGETIVLHPRHGRFSAHTQARVSFSYPLSVPGEVALPEAACWISAEVRDFGQPEPLTPSQVARRPPVEGQPGELSEFAVVAAAQLAPPLTVRSRREGDAFRPLGLGGRKKLQDFFVDRKVQRAVRDRVPLVVDGHDRIVWVAPYTIGDEFRVTDAAKAVVILKLKQLGGQG